MPHAQRAGAAVPAPVCQHQPRVTLANRELVAVCQRCGQRVPLPPRIRARLEAK